MKKRKIKIRKIADTIYVITAIVLVYIGFAGANLNKTELWLPSIIGLILIFLIRLEIINITSSRAKLKRWRQKYGK